MRAPSSGFTLLELLLAITVLGVVMAMLSLSLGGIVTLMETTEQQEAIHHQVQTALRRINEDLNGAVQLKEEPFVGSTHELGRERADTLAFPSLAHVVFNPEKQKTGLAFIRYRVQADAEEPRRLRLLRSDTPLLPREKAAEQEQAQGSGLVTEEEEREEEPAFLLADNLRSISFRYLDHKGQEFDSWQRRTEKTDETDETGEADADTGPVLPAAVFCTLEVWLDVQKELSQAFTTGMIIPLGLMTREPGDEPK